MKENQQFNYIKNGYFNNDNDDYQSFGFNSWFKNIIDIWRKIIFINNKCKKKSKKSKELNVFGVFKFIGHE